MSVLDDFWSQPVLRNALASVLLLFFLLLLRGVVLRGLRSWEFSELDVRRRWIVTIQNLGFLLLIFGLVVIWAEELRAFALSLAAVAVALVLATKEFLLCILGGLFRTSSKAFSVGDRVEIQGVRGDVIDENLFSTSLLEVGPGNEGHGYTGRQVTFPNSLLFTSPVVNESHSEHYVLHSFCVPMKMGTQWKQAQELLRRYAEEECQEYSEAAQKHFYKLARRRSVEPFSVQPSVSLRLSEPERVDLWVRVATPETKRDFIQQRIISRFLKDFYQQDSS